MDIISFWNLLTGSVFNIFITVNIILYVGIYIFYTIQVENLKANKKIFSSIVNILKEANDIGIFISRAKLVFEKYIQKNGSAKKDYNSVQDVIEDILYYLETRDDKFLKKYFGLVVSKEEKYKIYEFLEKVKINFPYDILDQKDRELVKNLNEAIEKTDKQTGKRIIEQLVRELHVKNKTIQIQDKRNTICLVVSVLGVFLTIFFGISAIIK